MVFILEYLEAPKGTNEKCPRKNGFFAHPNSNICDVFFNCIDGDAIEIKCTTGLHFDEYTGTCVWPDSAGRVGCKTAAGKCTYLQCEFWYCFRNDLLHIWLTILLLQKWPTKTKTLSAAQPQAPNWTIQRVKLLLIRNSHTKLTAKNSTSAWMALTNAHLDAQPVKCTTTNRKCAMHQKMFQDG